ncbi:hypothetical protein [Telluribacter sp.]|jgi:hypothetical protein|uniref:hypothetical protein n=1 Tax=Telluribacter sp. TaxID=1978767 RepID=UPI002E145389|nr:hypothetical protein [Telluribacter sp.]
MLKTLLAVFCATFGLVTASPGQVPDTSVHAVPGAQYALALYDSATTESQHLYNGPQYFIYDSQAPEHQFYSSEEWQTGSVYYDGQLFNQVPLLYDIVRDQVVIKYVKGVGNVILQSEKVHYFQIFPGGAPHHFIRCEARAGHGLRTGFYDVLYNGTSTVLARRIKERLEQVGTSKVTVEFPYKDIFYLKKNGKYQPVHSKKSVLALMQDQKKPVKQYLKQHNISFKENREAAIITLATYYDQLTNP